MDFDSNLDCLVAIIIPLIPLAVVALLTMTSNPVTRSMTCERYPMATRSVKYPPARGGYAAGNPLDGMPQSEPLGLMPYKWGLLDKSGREVTTGLPAREFLLLNPGFRPDDIPGLPDYDAIGAWQSAIGMSVGDWRAEHWGYLPPGSTEMLNAWGKLPRYIRQSIETQVGIHADDLTPDEYWRAIGRKWDVMRDMIKLGVPKRAPRGIDPEQYRRDLAEWNTLTEHEQIVGDYWETHPIAQTSAQRAKWLGDPAPYQTFNDSRRAWQEQNWLNDEAWRLADEMRKENRDNENL